MFFPVIGLAHRHNFFSLKDLLFLRLVPVRTQSTGWVLLNSRFDFIILPLAQLHVVSVSSVSSLSLLPQLFVQQWYSWPLSTNMCVWVSELSVSQFNVFACGRFKQNGTKTFSRIRTYFVVTTSVHVRVFSQLLLHSTDFSVDFYSHLVNYPVAQTRTITHSFTAISLNRRYLIFYFFNINKKRSVFLKLNCSSTTA